MSPDSESSTITELGDSIFEGLRLSETISPTEVEDLMERFRLLDADYVILWDHYGEENKIIRAWENHKYAKRSTDNNEANKKLFYLLERAQNRHNILPHDAPTGDDIADRDWLLEQFHKMKEELVELRIDLEKGRRVNYPESFTFIGGTPSRGRTTQQGTQPNQPKQPKSPKGNSKRVRSSSPVESSSRMPKKGKGKEVERGLGGMAPASGADNSSAMIEKLKARIAELEKENEEFSDIILNTVPELNEQMGKLKAELKRAKGGH